MHASASRFSIDFAAIVQFNSHGYIFTRVPGRCRQVFNSVRLSLPGSWERGLTTAWWRCFLYCHPGFKQEFVPGELNYLRTAMLYIAVALGGMIASTVLLLSPPFELCRCSPSPGSHWRCAITAIPPGWLRSSDLLSENPPGFLQSARQARPGIALLIRYPRSRAQNRSWPPLR